MFSIIWFDLKIPILSIIQEGVTDPPSVSSINRLLRGTDRRDDDSRKDYSIHGILGGKPLFIFWFLLFLLQFYCHHYNIDHGILHDPFRKHTNWSATQATANGKQHISKANKNRPTKASRGLRTSLCCAPARTMSVACLFCKEILCIVSCVLYACKVAERYITAPPNTTPWLTHTYVIPVYARRAGEHFFFKHNRINPHTRKKGHSISVFFFLLRTGA